MKVWAFAMLLWPLAALSARAANPAAAVDFNRDVRPILAENCFLCHGPDNRAREADLRLDSQQGLFQQLDDGPTVAPGKPEQSVLYRRVTSADADLRMPPPDSGHKLSAQQIAILKRWIEQGAKWQGHWAYVKPARPPVPQVPGASSVIDRFVRARLSDHGLHPSSPADARTLIRRLSFDLTGLPPSATDVRAFVAQPSDEAYKALVDKLLASQRYGERMASYWLDLVRYADTNGYHGDNHRDIYLYRDYVIDAFNRNKPFDRFTIEQLAGDLLPEPTREQLVASGYNRLLMTTREGGAQAKEYLAKYAADRVRNVSTTWLGATLGCAECHDHKFDPYLTREFYSFAAFFADIQETAVGAQRTTSISTPEQTAHIRKLDEQIAAVEAMLKRQTPALDAAQAVWEQSLRDDAKTWTRLAPASAKSHQGATLTISGDGVVAASGKNPKSDTYTLEFTSTWQGVTALRLEVLPDKAAPKQGPGLRRQRQLCVERIANHAQRAADHDCPRDSDP